MVTALTRVLEHSYQLEAMFRDVSEDLDDKEDTTFNTGIEHC